MEEIKIFDAHLDLAMNAMEWNRDLRLPLSEIRDMEKGMDDKPDRRNGVVSFPAMREANIPLCVGTLIARYVKRTNPLPGWNSPHQAWAQTQAQLAWYRAMEKEDQLKAITTTSQLQEHCDIEGKSEHASIGYILSLEGADSIVNMHYLEKMYEEGLRAVGPAHYGPGTYAQGTNATGGIGTKGKELLHKMDELAMILDATHLCDDSFWEAIEVFKGPIWASHSLCRSIVNHNRQFNDEQLKVLIEREAVIGMAFDAWMMIPGWERGKSTPESTGLNFNHLIDHIDHICQLTGDSKHVMLGTDLDGGFGLEQTPREIKSIANLQDLKQSLLLRDYSKEDVHNIFWQNGINFLTKHLPN